MYRDWQIRAIDNDHYVATWDRVLLQVWRNDTPTEAVTDLGRIARAFMAEARLPISSLAIIEPTAPPPSDVARTALAKFYRDLGPKMSNTIVVAEGGGFRAAFVRGVGITLSTLAPRSLPFKFVSSIPDAAALISPHLSPLAGGTEGLCEAIATLRAQQASVTATRP